MPAMGVATDVFISFVHEDEKVAAATKALVTNELLLDDRVFLSSEKGQIRAGDLWLEEIAKALGHARVVLLMMSKRSVRRPWVNFEAGGAWLKGCKLIPCCYGNQPKDALPQPYSSLHAVDLRVDAHHLLTSVHDHLGLQTPPPPSRQVKELFRGLMPKRWLDDVAASMDPYKRLETALDSFVDEP